MRILVTGSAGFIGYALCRRLLGDGHAVTGLDGFSNYYDVGLKRARHAGLASWPSFAPVEGRLEAPGLVRAVLERVRPEIVVHLAAQAGGRHSLEDPGAYVEANVVGTLNLLEAVRACPVRHCLIASTSSAYGGGARSPFTETDPVATPVSLYAATKLASEAMAHAYAHLFRQPITMLRFFTVYGPWGRPDMAVFLFTRRILAGLPIEVFSGGSAARDFTYIDDLVEALVRLLSRLPPMPGPRPRAGEVTDDSLSPVAPYRVVNIGGGQPVALDTMIAVLEQTLGRRAERINRPLPPGDVVSTRANPALLQALIGAVPETSIETGLPAFVRWYRDYYGA